MRPNLSHQVRELLQALDQRDAQAIIWAKQQVQQALDHPAAWYTDDYQVYWDKVDAKRASNGWIFPLYY